jgi:hypothetical protein
MVAAVAVLGLGGIGAVAASTAQTPVADVNVSAGAQSGHNVNTRDQAADDIELTQQSDVSQTETTTPFTYTIPFSGSNKVALDIASYFSSSITSVVQLHESGWGYGEIYKLYSYAKQTGKTIAEIQAMRDSGMGWGQIASALNLTPGNAGDNLGGVVSGRNVTTGTQSLTQAASSNTRLHENSSNKDKSKLNNSNQDMDNRANVNHSAAQGGNSGGKPGKKP